LELENRITPSNAYPLVGPLPPGQHQPAALQPAAATSPSDPSAPGTAVPSATIYFSALPTTGNYTFTIVLTARNGTRFSPEPWRVIGGANTTDLRDLVFDALETSGWNAVKVGADRLKVTSVGDGVDVPLSLLNEIIWGVSGVPRGRGLRVVTSGRVIAPTPDPGGPGLIGREPWGISFDTTDTASTIQEDAVVEAVVDGVTIDANVTAGMTPYNVAAALYSAMVHAGMTDASLSSYGFITFTLDTAGQYATDVSLQFTGPSGDVPPVDWLDMGIDIPWAGGDPPAPLAGAGQRAVADAVAIEAKVPTSVPSSAAASAPSLSTTRAGVSGAVPSGGEVTFPRDTAGLAAPPVSPTSTGAHSHGASAGRLDIGAPFTPWFTNQVVTFPW
jgi:hypothetical protein